MKKGYYIFPCGYQENAKDYVGVQKKIVMQCKEFSKYADIEYIPAYEIKPKSIIGKVRKRLLWHSANRNYEAILNQFKSPDFVYIRRNTADKKFIRFIRTIKEKFPKCKVIVEIYTYPYEKDEYKSLIGKLSLLKDRIYRKQYKGLVDRFVTYTDDDEIFGVKTIKTINGVDIDSFTSIIPRTPDNEIHLLAIAMFQKHHGYERIITGLKNYYEAGGKRNVKLYLVGEGPETQLYKDLANEYRLDDKVKFFGKRIGEELDEIYNLSDIGLGTFGFYKIGLETASSLKTKECLSKGLPIVAGNKENFVGKEINRYYLEFSNDATPVDVNKIVEFYDTLYCAGTTQKEIADCIHDIAKNTVSMEVTLRPIVAFIQQSL